MSAFVERFGVMVTIEKGEDGTPVIYVDTDENLEGDPKIGPEIRVYVNNEIVHNGTKNEEDN